MEQITHKVVAREMVGTDRLDLFYEILNVPFTPTHITFSNIYYDATNDDDVMYVLSTNLIRSLDNRIGVVMDKLSLDQPITFTNNSPIDGQYQFNITSPAYGGLHAGDFAFTITFIKKVQ